MYCEIEMRSVITNYTQIFYVSNAMLYISGKISTVGSLDREVKAVYEVTVKVQDMGAPPRYSKATVRVLVTDVNDNTPTFVEPQEASVSVREDQPAGAEVLQVSLIVLFI